MVQIIYGHKLRQGISSHYFLIVFSYWPMLPMACHFHRIAEISMIASTPRPGLIAPIAQYAHEIWRIAMGLVLISHCTFDNNTTGLISYFTTCLVYQKRLNLYTPMFSLYVIQYK